MSHIRFNVIAKGQATRQILRQHFTVNGTVTVPKEPVVAQVPLGGIVPEIYTHKKGEKVGQSDVALRANLLSIGWLKVGNRILGLKPIEADTVDDQAISDTDSAKETLSESSIQEMRQELKDTGAVRLGKDHLEFEQRRAFLSEHDMRWNRRREAWVRKGPR